MWDDVGSFLRTAADGSAPRVNHMRRVLVTTGMGALFAAACTHVLTPVPADWKQPLKPSHVEAVPPTPEMPPDPDALDDALRGRAKPPSLCFNDPQACGLDVPPMALAALRPLPEDLDVIDRALRDRGAELPVEARWLHCETLATWRPERGESCVTWMLGEDGVKDEAARGRALSLLDVMGARGEQVALRWLKHPDRAVRRDAAAWIGSRAITDDVVVPALEALNMEPDAEAAVSLIRTFSTLRDARAAGLLDRIARGDSQAEARVAAIDTLTDLAGARIRPSLLTINTADPRVKAAVVENLRRLNRWSDGTEDPFALNGGFDFMASSPKAPVGAVAFIEAFEDAHQRTFLWSAGEKLSDAETDELLRRLEDAGGYGLAAVRTTLARSLNARHLARLVDVRRAIFASGQPNREVLLRDLMGVVRVVREHFMMGRATRHWQRAPHAADGAPLRFHP